MTQKDFIKIWTEFHIVQIQYDGEYKMYSKTLKRRTYPAIFPNENQLKKSYSKVFHISIKNKETKLCCNEVIQVESHGWYLKLPSTISLIDKHPEPLQNE